MMTTSSAYTASPWTPATSLAAEWESVFSQRQEARLLIDDVLSEIGRLEPELARELSEDDCRHLRDAYLLRFVLPVAELAGWPAASPALLIKGLAVHFQWCLYWRSLDTLLDAKSRRTELVEDFVRVAVRTIQSDATLRAHHGLAAQGVTDAAQEPCLVFASEQSGTLPADALWRRAAPFLIVPQTVFFFEEQYLITFREYLNLLGLAHDAFDLFSDAQSEIRTVPLEWYRSIDAELQLRPRQLGLYYRHAGSELLAAANNLLARLDQKRLLIMTRLVGSIADLALKLDQAGDALLSLE